jgi:hypothetical protein
MTRRIGATVLSLLLTAAPAAAWLHGDLNDDKRITINEVIAVINGVLECDFGCRPEDCECQEFPACGVTFCTVSDAQFARCARLVRCDP